MSDFITAVNHFLSKGEHILIPTEHPGETYQALSSAALSQEYIVVPNLGTASPEMLRDVLCKMDDDYLPAIIAICDISSSEPGITSPNRAVRSRFEKLPYADFTANTPVANTY